MSQRVRCCPRCQHGGLDAFLLAFRFPVDFRFRLTREEYDALRFQIGTSKQAEGRGGRRYMPYAYTEQGVAMLSAVLRSDTAVQVSIQTLRVRIPPLAHIKAPWAVMGSGRSVLMAGTEGFEPPTAGTKNRSSTVELRPNVAVLPKSNSFSLPNLRGHRKRHRAGVRPVSEHHLR